MRILFLLTQDLESPAGIGRYFPWAKALVRRGHEVTIVALHADYAHMSQKKYIKDGVDVHYVAQMHVLKRGDQKYYYPAPVLFWRAIQATWALTKAAVSFSTDIIQVGKPQPMNGLAGLIAKVFRNRVLFVDCDDLEAANNRFSGGWQRFVVVFFEHMIPKQADHITTHTHVLHEHLLSMGIPSTRITYLPHGYDRDRFTAPSTVQIETLRDKLGLTGRKVIVYIGSMSLTSHAVDLLLEAFGIIRTAHPETILLLVGGGIDYDNLRHKALEIGLGEAAIFCGRVPSDEVSLYYRLGNVSVDPIPDNDSGRASLSLKMFESWACGVPLVTVDIGDRRTILGVPPAGLLVSPGDPVALAKTIQEILDQPELGLTLAQRGLTRVKEFSWDRLVEQLEGIYLKTIARRTAH